MLKSNTPAKPDQPHLTLQLYTDTQRTKGEQRIMGKDQILFYGTHKVLFNTTNASEELPAGQSQQEVNSSVYVFQDELW